MLTVCFFGRKLSLNSEYWYFASPPLLSTFSLFVLLSLGCESRKWRLLRDPNPQTWKGVACGNSGLCYLHWGPACVTRPQQRCCGYGTLPSALFQRISSSFTCASACDRTRERVWWFQAGKSGRGDRSWSDLFSVHLRAGTGSHRRVLLQAWRCVC